MKQTTSLLLTTLLLTAFAIQAQTIEEFEVKPGGTLEVDLETGGSIEIRGWDRNLVRVEAEPHGRGAAPEVKIRPTDNGVKLTIEEGDRHEWSKRGHHDHRGYRVEVQVPRRFDLEIETMGGGITIIDVEGRIEGETMGGELDLSNLKGRLDLTTMGGNIRLVDSEVDGKVATMGGKVLLENVVGDVDGSSMGGNVIYKNVQRSDGSSTGKVVHITTMGGEIELDEAPHGAKLHTMGGDIELRSAAEFVEAETMGGDVVLHEVDGWVNATTMGGDVEVSIIGDPQASGKDIELVSMSGDIHLVVPRNFSMTVDVELAYTKRRTGVYSIQSDFELETRQDTDWRYDHGSARRVIYGTGSFAGGKNKVTIRTVNGNVHLKQR